jgi:hypothetical protein
MSKVYGGGAPRRGRRKLAIMKAMLLCLAAVLAMPLAAAEKVYTIDAVRAIGGALSISLKSSVLF